MEGVGPLSLSLRGLRGCLCFCIISAENLVLGVELIMPKMRIMGRCLTLILLSAVLILITAGKYTRNETNEVIFRCYLGAQSSLFISNLCGVSDNNNKKKMVKKNA